jgi:hypothetical protein
VSNDLDKLSPYLCEGSIVSLLASDERNSFYSMDSLGRVVRWVM